MGTALSTIRNIGPKMTVWFERAGITDAETLREMGADAAYEKLLVAGDRPHFIAYYALVMGMQGRPWNDCKGQEKDDLRVVFDQIVARVEGNKAAAPTGIEAFLNRIGTGNQR